jgi:hypothetical protein
MLHPGRVEGRAPAALVIPRELEVVALARHADRRLAASSLEEEGEVFRVVAVATP